MALADQFDDMSDLTQPLDLVELTGSDSPFALFPEAKKRFQEAADDPENLFGGRTLQSTVVHMGLISFEREKTGVAGAAAAVTPGILAAGRVFKPVAARKGIMVADPKFAETPYIKAAEQIAHAVYAPTPDSPLGREATPA